MAPTEPLIFVLHGARGDLAKRMVLPALATLQRRGLLPKDWALLGTGRTAISSQEFDQLLRDAVEEFGDAEAAEGVPALTEHTAYCGDVSEDDSADEFPGELDRLRGVLGGDVTVIHYLAVPPSSFAPITRALAKAGLTDGVRIVYEKPYGTSPDRSGTWTPLSTRRSTRSRCSGSTTSWARRRRRTCTSCGSPTSCSGDLEPRARGAGADRRARDARRRPARRVLRRDRCRARHAGHASVPGGRGGGDGAAAPPRRRGLGRAREDVIAHFRPLDPMQDVVLGQFDGYRDIDAIPEDSTTDTFVAARLWVDTDRWRGVPFLLRTGKRMAASAQQVTLVLRTPDELFGSPVGPNRVIVSLKGSGQIKVTTTVKQPGAFLELGTGTADLALADVEPGDPLPAYAGLLEDVLVGDRTLFTTPTGLESAWRRSSRCWATTARRPSRTRPGPGGRPRPTAWRSRTAGSWATDRSSALR